ncbi:extracellular solute-binding protein [Dongia sedimenti]|uniref:Extracellular solute-binding protein n=1 Tax=Dongia sedimenti TaxID=3064282 RepID=A0ABU0YTL5_9PROT|nr:extracellular solute-binding protein [Rhodospirillaceae bacterium R-7]
MKFTRRKLLLATAAGFMAAPTILARADDKVTLRVTHGAPTYLKMLGALKDAFNAQDPNLAVEFVTDGDNWDPLLQNTLREAVVGDLPDGTWQSITYAPLLARRGLAQPLTALAAETKDLQTLGIARPLAEATMLDGKVYAVPFGTTIPVVYYNMDLLRKAGYQAQELPKTWDEIIAIGKKVLALDPKINGGYFEYGSTNAWLFQNLLASHGGRMMQPGGTDIAFNGAEGLKSLEVLWQFGEINTVDMTIEQSRQAFNAGASGIQVRTASGIGAVAKAAAGHFELGIGEFPIPASGGRLVGAGHSFIMFTKDRRRQEAFTKFARFAAGPAGQSILAANTGYLPVNTDLLNDPKFIADYFQKNPYHRPVLAKLGVTGDQYSFPSDNTVKIVEMMSEEMRQVLVHQVQPADALKTMADQARSLLQKA